MCGIAGIYDFKSDRPVRPDEVVLMRDSLTHRGPDGEGLYISPNQHVGLGHRRLAIIDLSSTGAQPMATPDNNLHITFNGEIYNFPSLRSELKTKGYTFTSQSDTEVILRAYEAYGPDCVKHFNGMFAFVIWDEAKQTFFAARDHLGIKPFYYAVQNNRFYFGSEIKAILAHPNFRKDLDEDNVALYLTFSSLPAPHTLFQDVKKLPAAHTLTIKPDHQFIIEEYWNPASPTNQTPTSATANYYINQTRQLLSASISQQMISDVPFGCFLSGGIDSSTNAALMSRALGKPIDTFSIGSKEFSHYNEFSYSRDIAKRLGARTHEISVSHADLINFLPHYAHHADDPNGDQICFLIYYLSQLIKANGVIVAQVGEGSDEIFAGYDTYLLANNLYHKIWRWLRPLPYFIRALPHLFLSLLPLAHLDFWREYARRLRDGEEPFWGNAIAWTPTHTKRLLSVNYQAKLARNFSYHPIAAAYQEINQLRPKASFLERLTYLELKIRLPELLLSRVDKMAMAHSIETRVPFLDTKLVELAFNIPDHLKLKNKETKYILKQAVTGIIPDEIIWRKKQGFGGPIKEWLANPKTAKPLTDIIFNSRLKEKDLLNYDYLKTIIADHQAGRVDNNFRLWNIITLSLWYDHWFK